MRFAKGVVCLYKVVDRGLLKRVGLMLFLLAALGILFSFMKKDVLSVSGKSRKLPIYSVNTAEKKVSLGINCAWDDSDIDELLSILDRYQVKATFFLLGQWCEKYPESVQKLVNAGHELGNHSDTHPDMTTLSRERICEEITDAGKKIEEVSGKKVTLFRPPSGAYNDLVIETAQELGYQCIQWDCDSIDWKDPTPQQMKERIMKKITNGSIMLFHSGAKNTPEALPDILDAILKEGYEIVPVSQLIFKENYKIDANGRQYQIS